MTLLINYLIVALLIFLFIYMFETEDLFYYIGIIAVSLIPVIGAIFILTAWFVACVVFYPDSEPLRLRNTKLNKKLFKSRFV